MSKRIINGQTVTIDRARALSHEGQWLPTGPQHKVEFRARYMITWRPQPELPEAQQFAIVEEV